MSRRGGRWLTFAATLSASLLSAVAIVLATGWGADDLYAFFVWTIPFAGVIALVVHPIGRRLPGGRSGVAVAVVSGLGAGLLWTIVVALLLGPYVFAFGFAIWIAWALGGAAGLVAGAALASPRPLRLARTVAYGTLALVIAANLALTAAAKLLWSGSDVVAELDSGTSDAQAEAFVWDVVMEESGVDSVTQNDPLVLEIELTDGATETEEAELLKTLRNSPLVARVETDE